MAGKIVLALAMLVAQVAAFAPSFAFPAALRVREARQSVITMGGKENELRVRIKSVGNTQKITTAMRLVAAAKVRRAQQAVLATRPFSETLQSVFGGLLERLGNEDADLPLLETRDVKKVTLVIMSGDRGLCGGYNSYGIKKAEQRIKELTAQGVGIELVTIGKKASQYFKRRDTAVIKTWDMGQAPNSAQANSISEFLLSSYLAGDTDSVEIIYTKFVSLIASTPSIRTMLPLSPKEGLQEGDELYQLTTKNGKFAVEKTEGKSVEPKKFPKDMIFEQDPVQILNSILPLYFNGQILRMLQESVASELAARMTAMAAASDNAKALKKELSLIYNRARQASVTAEILEIVAGANAANE
jgi:F-type H+-transporting ATPase subunit gamma